jgi:TfoX/Sxy family transcriptional regulator of competence genes
MISENQMEKIKSKIHEYVKKYGSTLSRQIFGDKVLTTIGFNNNPMEFLNLFNDLEVVQSVEYKDYSLLRHGKGKNLILYNRENKYVYINYYQIWSVLLMSFGLTNEETKQLTKEWVGVVYNLRDITTTSLDFESSLRWE